MLGQTPTFDAEQDVVEQEDDAEADEGSQEDDSKMPHSTLGLAGSAMAVVAVGGSIFAAVHYYRRWRAQGGSASKYMPVLTRE